MAHARIHINEAVRVSGRSRRSLYRDMKSGALSYHVDNAGRRLVDVSELIRAYGALPGMAEEPAPTPGASESEGGDLSSRLLAELVELTRQQGETLDAQRKELAALRHEVAELRSLPAPSSLAPHPDAPTPPSSPRVADESAQVAVDPASEPPRNFGDLLSRFENRTSKH